MRHIVLAFAVCVAVSMDSAAVARPPDAREYFLRRQTEMVTLAGHLGALHRLHQLCGNGSSDKFRDHMREIIPLESPLEGTRLDMISAFNEGYRGMSDLHLSCGPEAESDYRRRANQALQATNRLSSPFR